MDIPETARLLEPGNTKSKQYPKYTFITPIETNKDKDNDKSEISIISEISENDVGETNKRNNICSLIGGLICIVVAVIDWVTMSEVIQSSEQNNYNKPFLLRFVVNSGYTLMLIPWICVYSINKRLVANNMTFTHWRSPHNELQQTSQQASYNISFNNVGELVIDHQTNKFHVFLSLVLVNFFSLSSGYIWYLSLSKTVASINNTIFQSNCVFVLIYSRLLLGEKLSFMKCVAAIIAISGVALISFSTPSSASASASLSVSDSLIGIILCILSMMLFSLFEVLFKYFGHKYFRYGYELSDTLLFQAGIGLCNMFLFWPFIVLFNDLKIETFQLPTNYDELINGILLPCFLDLLFTSSLLCGITFCGALFMSVGLILVIPITFFSDIVIFKKISMSIINIYSVAGAVCIIIGFIIIQITHNQKPTKSNENGKSA